MGWGPTGAELRVPSELKSGPEPMVLGLILKQERKCSVRGWTILRLYIAGSCLIRQSNSHPFVKSSKLAVVAAIAMWHRPQNFQFALNIEPDEAVAPSLMMMIASSCY